MLEAQSIGRKATKQGHWLIHGVSLCVQAGDRLAIIGPSGSGKTALLRALSFLDSLCTGSILWNDGIVHHSSVPEFRSHVMYLRQQPALIEGTVEDNLRRPFALHVHRHREFDRERIVELLDTLQRDQTFLDKQGGNLSGGETQIVSLLRAIQLEPQILLLDEPTASLDSDTALLMEKVVADWMEQSADKRATVWVSHNREQTERVADKRFRLERGHLKEGN